MKKTSIIAMLVVTATACSVAWCKDSPVSDKKKDKEPRGAWLGVRLSPVPPPLRAHLGLKDKGVMIDNIVEDSPADKAGIEQYDVIVSLDGEGVSDEVGDFIDAVRKCSPGDKLKLGLLRRAAERKVTVKLGKPVPAGKAKFKHEPRMGILRHEFMRMHPHMLLRKGPDGWLEMKEMELPGDLQKLLKDKKRLFGRFDIRIPEVRIGRGRSTTEITINDRTTRIEVDSDGKVTVTKTFRDSDGNVVKTTTEYDSLDKLREIVPDAFKMFRGSTLRLHTSARAATGKKRPGGREFSVGTDGGITVRSVKGDSSLIREFKNERDLKKRAPKLYEEYRKLNE